MQFKKGMGWKACFDETADCSLAHAEQFSRLTRPNQSVRRNWQNYFAVQIPNQFKKRFQVGDYRLQFPRPFREFRQRVQVQGIHHAPHSVNCACALPAGIGRKS